MSEIEREIEFMYGERTKAASMYLKNTDERVVALIDRVVVYYDTAMQALRAELSRQENAPLTWEELVSMTRKTVYIVDRTDDEKSGWAIVGKQYIKIGLEFVTLCENLAFRRELKELYGQTWIAYRYEPKGESK